MSLRDYLFHEEPGITLYCGDCRDIMPQLSGFARPMAIVTDPPYGISLPTAYQSRGRGQLATAHNFPVVCGDDIPFDPASLLLFAHDSEVILWGADHYFARLPDRGSWLIWDKRTRDVVNDSADAEMAWLSKSQPVRLFRHMWTGYWRDSERGESYHPTQKPVALMKWCLSFTESPRVIDPYCGSGPTLIAAKESGRVAIGIEIEPRYCEIAVKRLRQEVLPLTLV